MPNLIREQAQRRSPELYDDDEARFGRVEPELRRREQAFLQAGRRQLLRPEGGLPEAPRVGGVLRGADLVARAPVQAGYAAQLAQLVGGLGGQRQVETDQARARFMAERLASRLAAEEGLRRQQQAIGSAVGTAGYRTFADLLPLLIRDLRRREA